jgi:hypothetical protein
MGRRGGWAAKLRNQTPKPVTLEQQGLLHTILWRSRAAQSEITLHHMLSQIYGVEGCPCNNGSPHSMEGVVWLMV